MIGVRVTPEIKKQVEETARSQGMTPSQWVRKIILEKLKEPTEIDKIKRAIEEHEKRIRNIEDKLKIK